VFDRASLIDLAAQGVIGADEVRQALERDRAFLNTAGAASARTIP
jgi:hypothetical protein